MTSSVQERLQFNRIPLDKWTTREQLCLASAVSCSGDQNWMSVSRTVKLICGNDTIDRPADWFSQKNCAMQYGQLLENVETPRRKKRTSESASGVSSPAIVETPTDLILRRLNEERIQELKSEIRKEQEEYAKIYRELKALQSGELTEEEMHEMLIDMEKQEEQQRVKEMKLENQMCEREQHRLDIQRNWRTLTPATTSIVSLQNSTDTADTTTVDMDVEEIDTTANKAANTDSNQTKQQQQAGQPDTSPLLSSLLKSPTSGVSVAPTTNPTVNVSNNSSRTSAPTITSLLTSGSIPNANQPAIILKSGIPPQKAAQLLTSPISGPPSMMTGTAATGTMHNLLSPSQAAPTLSMLLEKNKATASTMIGNRECRNESLSIKTSDPMKRAEKDVTDEVPMELDEDVNVHVTNTNADMTGGNDSDEPDPIEEQQLLEVFKNIGNIDELDIDVSAVIDDEEVDFLKGIGAESPSETANVTDFGSREGTEIEPKSLNEIVEDEQQRKQSASADNVHENSKTTAEAAIHIQLEGNATPEVNIDNKTTKVETISSDDSNDNIPLAAVASLEQRSVQEKVFFHEKSESEIKNDTVEGYSEPCNETLLTSFEEEDKTHDKLEKQLADLVGASDTDDVKNLEDIGKSPADSDNSDVIVIPTDDDDSSGDKVGQSKEKPTVEAEAARIKKDLEAVHGTCGLKGETEQIDEPTEGADITSDTLREKVVPVAAIISIADTDEDSSTTDISIATRKDEKTGNALIKHSVPQSRKGIYELTRHDQQNKTDDESTTQFSSSSSSSITPARPPLLRKLRDRDRSESPMIEGDPSNGITTSSTTICEHLNNQRLRRRYSSTPVNDSVPNSPASSDRDRDELEARASKKLLLNIYYSLQHSKNAITLQRAFNEDAKLNDICLRPMDMPSIRKHIEIGTIRNVYELQRDIMLMCQNGLMLFKQNTTSYIAAQAFIQECQGIREFIGNSYGIDHSTQKSEAKDAKDVSKPMSVSGPSMKSRSGSRKSQRIS